ncbi:calmodulin-binding protein 60 A-like protein [Cinnamomum micranthum f. kanehirae]|uniref:Calmodulin-binding protein 60 A-like protein n=1 Tax=Cinnamomum micranthum f. kanehirae TaxID=337451 RepID=A0A443NF13_9MAGN|nr:calmodulin-binding protein 60 A-like protein [Cinnamomum micranthum f. kanehirae]
MKRHPDEDDKVESEGSESPNEKRQKVPALRNVIIEATKQHAFQKFLEPLLRRVVKEEVELALTKHLACKKRHCGKQIYPSTSTSLELQFTSKLSLPIFTGTKIEGEDCPVLNVSLVDAFTGRVVTSGPESSIKVEIVVLEGDFEGNEDENWTFKEFQDNVVREREGKRPLLTGDVLLNLNEGTGALGDLMFTDNSSWTRSRKFRLGARVGDGYFGETRVKEAKTEAFVVKDHRGELYKKHYPPSLSDEVWRLEKIGKDGAFHKRLSSANINTVKEFLTVLCTDAQSLRNILGNGMSAKMWELTVDHARTCTLDGHNYMYYPNTQQRMGGVVFNVVGEVVGLLSDGQFVPCSELSDIQKEDALKLVKAAFAHWDDVVLYKDGAIAGSSSHAPTISFPSNVLTEENPYSSFPDSHKSGGFSFIRPSVSSPDFISSMLSSGGLGSSDDFALHDIGNMEFRNEPEPHGFASHDVYKDSRGLGKISNSLTFDAESVSQTFCSEDHFRYFDTEISSQPQTLSLVSQADVSCFLPTQVQRAAAHCKARTTWMMLKTVLLWRFSIKRIVAKKKKSRMRELERYG